MQEEIYYFGQYNDPARFFNVIMSGLSYCDETYVIERSDYPYFVIEHVIDGTGILETDGQNYELVSGDTYFLYKGKSHKYYCKGHTWIKLWIVVDGSLVDVLLDDYLSSRPNMLQGFDILDSLKNAFDLAKSKEIDYFELTNQFALIVHRILISAERFQQKRFTELHEQIKKYIDDNLLKTFDLGEMSKKFHYSKNHIINVFRTHYGVTPHKYYNDQKMLVAKDLLLNTSITVNDLSNHLGFDDPQYFSKCFKKYYGITPFHERLEARKKPGEK